MQIRRGLTIAIHEAGPADVEALTALINAAFIVEHVVFDGDRVDAAGVRGYMQKGTFLVGTEAGAVIACVYVELREDHGYLGLLSVDPARQGCGLGGKMVAAAEDLARRAGARVMDLRVISARSELLPFYERLGYQVIRAEPFPANLPAKMPSHFIHLSKPLV